MEEEEVVEIVDKWAEFRIGPRRQIYMFIVGEASILDELIPENAHELGTVILETDEEGNPTKTRQKTVREFISGGADESGGHYTVSPDGSKAVILASAMEDVTYRQHPFSEKDAEDWSFFKEAVWGDRAEIITHARYLEIIKEWYPGGLV